MAERVAAALREATAALQDASVSPRLDAELLMAQALGCTRSALIVQHLHQAVPDSFADLLHRRLAREPIAYITGRAEFYGLELAVSPAVLIPRADSETLIDAARLALAERPPARILDLGAGSAALLLAALALWPGAKGVGIDRSAAALAVARLNAEALGLAGRATLVVADWTQTGWAAALGQFDLILANPPYVETGADLAADVRDYEPAEALFAGAQGLDDYRRLLPRIPALLAPGGVAFVEIGSTQAEAVAAIAARAGLSGQLHHDLAARPRALELRPGQTPSGDKS